jgi:RsiW-degrading membrane proteinase PrsW (M82 family)
MTLETLIISAVVGIVPALFWLWFWLREDRLHPEPKKMILLSFFMGMLSVAIVLPIEHWIKNIFICSSCVPVIILWALTEEFFKFGAGYVSAFRTKAFDEPVDAMVYLITSALGFAALENTLFLLTPMYEGNIFESIDTANLRFVGASLLHIITSGAIGAFIAFAFYKSKKIKRWFLLAGVILAVVLHTLFNLFIIKNDGDYTFFVFSTVWTIAVLLILVFEKVKKIQCP